MNAGGVYLQITDELFIEMNPKIRSRFFLPLANINDHFFVFLMDLL
jgi:hypothetical protein